MEQPHFFCLPIRRSPPISLALLNYYSQAFLIPRFIAHQAFLISPAKNKQQLVVISCSNTNRNAIFPALPGLLFGTICIAKSCIITILLKERLTVDQYNLQLKPTVQRHAAALLTKSTDFYLFRR